MKLIVTRPRQSAEATAEALSVRGHEAIVAPVIEIRPLPAALPRERFQAILITSANAARRTAGDEAFEAIRRLPALCVGPATAEAAVEAGFRVAHAADGDGASLAELVRRDVSPADGPLLHLSGRHIALDLAALLAPGGYEVRRLPVYESVIAEHLPGNAASAMERGEADGVLLYSPRSARAFCELSLKAGLGVMVAALPCACLSRAVADAALSGGATRVGVAQRPEEQELFTAAEAVVAEARAGRP